MFVNGKTTLVLSKQNQALLVKAKAYCKDEGARLTPL
ncbi:MAG: Fur family zinc uptake transcriptional regulator, partial [Glaciecola sp.]